MLPRIPTRKSCCSLRRVATRRGCRGARRRIPVKPVGPTAGRSRLGERLAPRILAPGGEDRRCTLFRDCGILRVDRLETLIEIGPMLEGRRPPDSIVRRRLRGTNMARRGSVVIAWHFRMRRSRRVRMRRSRTLRWETERDLRRVVGEMLDCTGHGRCARCVDPQRSSTRMPSKPSSRRRSARQPRAVFMSRTPNARSRCSRRRLAPSQPGACAALAVFRCRTPRKESHEARCMAAGDPPRQADSSR